MQFTLQVLNLVEFHGNLHVWADKVLISLYVLKEVGSIGEHSNST